MPIYPVLDNLDRGKRYVPGSQIELDAANAAPLIELGVLGAALSESTAKPQDSLAGQQDTGEGKGEPEGTGEAQAGAGKPAPAIGDTKAAKDNTEK